MYVLSTCVRPDNRYLWQHYAENGDGVAIGIDASTLYEQLGGYERRKTPYYIDITPMDYDMGAFLQRCRESIEGLSPFDWSKLDRMIRNKELKQEDIKDSTEMLKKYVSGYAAYAKKRSSVMGYITLQKADRFCVEEETRIIHSPKLLHPSLPLDVIPKTPWQKYPRAILPIVSSGKHFLREVVLLSSDQARLNDVNYWIKHRASLGGVKLRTLDRTPILANPLPRL